MELRQLRYFATVAHELNFTRAAEKLHVAQPALSRQIKQLEAELGVILLDRDKRTVRLTAAGEHFLQEALGVLAQADSALAHARSGTSKRLNVGYVWGLFHSFAPAAMQRLRSVAPDLALNLFDMTASEQGRRLQPAALISALSELLSKRNPRASPSVALVGVNFAWPFRITIDWRGTVRFPCQRWQENSSC